MSPSEHVLLTGGNGVVGSAVLIALCKAGYQVRAVVRRQDAIDKATAHPLIKQFSSQIQWGIIPDISKPDAFLNVVVGCNHSELLLDTYGPESEEDFLPFVHVASPIPTVPPRPMDMRTPAEDSTKAILNAAECEPLVRRVVITGSIASLVDPRDPRFTHPDCNSPETIPQMTGATYYPLTAERPDDDAPVFQRYVDSKVASGHLAREYAEAKPDLHFQIVLLCPGWVLGPGLFITNRAEAMGTANLTLSWVMADLREAINPVLGVPMAQMTPIRGEFVWIDDVALGHVRALSVPLPSGTNLEVWVMAVDSPHGARIEDAEGILKRRSPELAKQLSFSGKMRTHTVNFDATRAEDELLGKKYVPFEDQVVRAVEWMVSLPDGEPLRP